MSTQKPNESSTLAKLILAAYKGSVFGQHESFPRSALLKIDAIQEQIHEIGAIFSSQLYSCIHTAQPELSNTEIERIIKEIGPKAVAFCPALTAGELTGETNTQRLAAAASAIGIMYFADQSIDRGDELMVEAIETAQDLTPKTISTDVANRIKALDFIRSNINHLAPPEDAPIVLDCFSQQVLYNEALLHDLSLAYLKTDENDRQAFLTEHAGHLTELMVTDAGFPSVTTALYAIYRQNDPSLLPLRTVHNDEAIIKLLQICNVVVRIADEIGDWEIDAGKHPHWGVFSINPLNQYHPKIVEKFYELGAITSPRQQQALQELFSNFHTNPKKYGAQITDLLFNHVRDYVNDLPPDTSTTYSQYILLCKRVLEIGLINILGDKALADT